MNLYLFLISNLIINGSRLLFIILGFNISLSDTIDYSIEDLDLVFDIFDNQNRGDAGVLITLTIRCLLQVS